MVVDTPGEFRIYPSYYKKDKKPEMGKNKRGADDTQPCVTPGPNRRTKIRRRRQRAGELPVTAASQWDWSSCGVVDCLYDGGYLFLASAISSRIQKASDKPQE